MAWSSILCFQDTANSPIFGVDELLELFPSPDACEERRKFTRVHKIVLRLLYVDLEQELQTNTHAIDQIDNDGRSPLHWAVARGDSKAVDLLLRYGADPNKVDRIKQGPLRSSLKAEDPTCMKMLIKAGANVHQRDNWKQTPLIAALFYQNPETYMAPLIKAGSDVNIQDHTGSTPLIQAAAGNHLQALRLLLENGAGVNIRDNLERTAFHHAIKSNAVEAMAILLTHGIDHTVQDHDGYTALHFAAEFAGTEMLDLLTRSRMRGLDAEDENHDGKSAFEIAENRRKELLRASVKTPADPVLEKEKVGDGIHEAEIWSLAWRRLVKSTALFQSPKKMNSWSTDGCETGSEMSHESWHSTMEYLNVMV